MKTRFIRYGVRRSLPGYHNVKVEREIELEEGDDPDEVMLKLRSFVEGETGLNENYICLQERVRDLDEQCTIRADNLNYLRERFASVVKDLERSEQYRGRFIRAIEMAIETGVNVPEELKKWIDEDFPF